MPIEILMPALSPTMTEGNLARWLKKEGDEVRSGDVVAEIETDKATMEVEAVEDGRIGRLLVPEGAQGIKVNQPIALLLAEDEDAADLPEVPAAARPAPAPLPAPPAVPVAEIAGNPPYTEKPHSSMRRVIARRLTEAKQNVPHFYLTVDCEIDELLRIRQVLNDGNPGLNLSVNDFVIRAAALALRQVPAANASWREDAIILWQRADIAMAVALDDGLITPIIRGADLKGLQQIAAETKDLAQRARAGKLKLEEFQGGTFSISNLGMYGVREFAAVINPPHGCILAVGAGAPRPVVKNGQLAVATVMTCTLSCDHRAVDGAVGAQFLAAFKRLIDEPARMLL